MRSLFQHRRETEKFAVRRFVDYNFLMLLVDGRHSHPPRHHYIRLTAGVADLVDPLPWSEGFYLHLSCQHPCFFVIEQCEKRNVFQYFRIACHGIPRRVECGSWIVSTWIVSTWVSTWGLDLDRLGRPEDFTESDSTKHGRKSSSSYG